MVDATAALLSGRTLRSLILTRYDPATSPVPLHGDVGPTGRYCEPCGRWQGVRVKHCRACGRCVARFDHHCGWLGTCVGRHNQRLFFGFLSIEMVVTWYAFGVTVYETVKVANRPPWGRGRGRGAGDVFGTIRVHADGDVGRAYLLDYDQPDNFRAVEGSVAWARTMVSARDASDGAALFTRNVE